MIQSIFSRSAVGCASAIFALAAGSAYGADATSSFSHSADAWRSACTQGSAQKVVSRFTGDLATTIDSSIWFAGGATENGAPAGAGNPVLPPHCVVTGVIDPYVGDPDATRYGNNFKLRIPLDWNGRYFFQGGGGNNGIVGNALGELKDGQYALLQGYAVVAQDSGHSGREPNFALDRKAYVDFAYESVHDAARVTKAIIEGIAGHPPDHSYFVGCSNGGREAMVTAQRYDDFDGVVAGDPAMSAFDQWIQNISVLRAMSEAAGTPAGTAPTDTSKAYTDDQLAYAGKYFEDKCDRLDGVVDGLMSNYRACRATPEDLQALQCKASGGASTDANCLDAAQIEGLRKIYSSPANASARIAIPGFLPGSIERLLRDTYLGKPGSEFPLGVLYSAIMPNMYFMGYGFLGYPDVTGPANRLSSYPKSAMLYVARFDFDREPAKLEPGRLALQADNIDPSRPGPSYENFRKRGGKMLIYTGTADPAVQPTGLMAFADRLNAFYTPDVASSFARLFLIPGMNHCRGGSATERFDQLAPLVAWVEEGIAPDRIVAKAVPGSALDRALPGVSRPLCGYPKYAKYQGSGDVANAENFVCAAE